MCIRYRLDNFSTDIVALVAGSRAAEGRGSQGPEQRESKGFTILF